MLDRTEAAFEPKVLDRRSREVQASFDEVPENSCVEQHGLYRVHHLFTRSALSGAGLGDSVQEPSEDDANKAMEKDAQSDPQS